jgi:hypothetical protein
VVEAIVEAGVEDVGVLVSETTQMVVVAVRFSVVVGAG